MHGSIRKRLEDLLSAERKSADSEDLTNHLASCSECSSELLTMQAHGGLLQTLRATKEVEPAPGFYSRVLQRIDERTKETVWSSLIYSPIFTRVAYASITLAVVLGSYVVASETRDGHLHGQQIVAQNVDYDVPVVGSQSQQRDAVLTNFASH